MRKEFVIGGLLLSACDVEQITDNIKTIQAFEIYNAGEYSFIENCPPGGTLDDTLSFYRTAVRIGHEVCDVRSIDMSDKHVGFELELKNCRDDSGPRSDFNIVIHNGILHGLGEKETKIYRCDAENK